MLIPGNLIREGMRGKKGKDLEEFHFGNGNTVALLQSETFENLSHNCQAETDGVEPVPPRPLNQSWRGMLPHDLNPFLCFFGPRQPCCWS